jgi:multimeric flavodoxin WrbA
MKVLMINGSPKANGNTATALKEMEKIFLQEGIEVETVQVGHLPVRGCIACQACKKTGKCAFDDIVNVLAEKLEASDGSPIRAVAWFD